MLWPQSQVLSLIVSSSIQIVQRYKCTIAFIHTQVKKDYTTICISSKPKNVLRNGQVPLKMSQFFVLQYHAITLDLIGPRENVLLLLQTELQNQVASIA